MRAKMSLIDLVNALEATTTGLFWHVDLVTGDLLPCTDGRGPVPVGDRMRALPRAAELPERSMRLGFCERLRDADARAALVAAADDDVPHRAFEQTARRVGLLDDWLAHRRAQLVPIALALAAAQNVTCRGDALSPSFAVN